MIIVVIITMTTTAENVAGSITGALATRLLA